MKIYLTSIFLLLSAICFGQFYDDFSDGNYTSNPRWFMTDMDAQIVENNDGYAVELHPTGEIENSSIKKGSFRTANTQTDNTWWGCDLTFDVNENSEGEIRFYLMSTLPNLGSGEGIYLSINTKSRLLYFIYENKGTKIITRSKTEFSLGSINLSCAIAKQNKEWQLECKTDGKDIAFSPIEVQNIASLELTMSTGFVVYETLENPINLRVNRVNCGKKPEEAEMIGEGDIVITEIMAKPNPAVGLPEVEWIEIYNNSDEAVALGGCKISSPSKTGTLNDYILESHDYAVLCSYNAAVEMSAISQKICIVESMPALNNNGNILTLKNRQNHTISFVEYSTDWYKSEPFKSDGGWSLERIDPNNPLSNAHTWGPSIDPRGGTPAEINSIAMELPDVLIPRIIGFGVENEKLVHIYFNKPMQGEIIELKKSIAIVGNSLKSLNWIEPQRQTLSINLTEPLDSSYAIDINFSDMRCVSGWSMADTTITLALPHQTQYMDIIFNELMPYVSNGNSKFIELYNNSDFYLDLSRLMLSNRDENNNLKSSKIFCSTSTILPPHRFAVISPDTSAIHCALGVNPQSIYFVSALPSMPAKEGTLVLTDRGGNIVDEIDYSDSWHHPQLSDSHDISLERIDSMAPTQSADNWSSCSIKNSAGWQNSQSIKIENEVSNRHFWLETNSFSPNNDGHQDHLIIHHNLPTAGYTMTIDAYTRHGAHICKMIDNKLIDPEGYVMWDGTTKDGTMIPTGLYVIVVRATNEDGDKIETKLIAIKI
jgi:hypothetical protein